MAAIDNALNFQQNATNQASALNRDLYGQQQKNLNPYMQAGQGALPNLTDMAGQPQAGQQYMQNIEGMNPQMSQDYGQLLQDPGYQFVNEQAQEQARRMLSGSGMTGSRAGMDILSDVGQRTAIAERDRFDRNNQGNYDRAYGQQADLYNMANQGQGNQFNQQMGIAGLGQNAATNLAGMAGQYGQNQTNLMTGMANAQASGVLSNDAMQAQQGADQNALWAGAAGTALGNWDSLKDIGSSIYNWF